MKSREKPLFDAKEIAEQWPELENKQQASIRNDWIRQAMVPNYHVEDNLG